MSPTKIRTARPARPVAPPMPAMAALDETHRQMLQTLAEMGRLVELLASREPHPDAAALAERTCRFFNRNARVHHEREETEVFPQLLRDADPELLRHVRRLQQDHMWLEEDWLELEPHLQAIARGYAGEHCDFLRAALPEFSAICQDHIALEESVVYPQARRAMAGQQPVKG